MAGVQGFEPRYGGIRIHCLTAWRHPKEGRQPEKNMAGVPGFEPGVPGSKPGALPLGDTP